MIFITFRFGTWAHLHGRWHERTPTDGGTSPMAYEGKPKATLVWRIRCDPRILKSSDSCDPVRGKQLDSLKPKGGP